MAVCILLAYTVSNIGNLGAFIIGIIYSIASILILTITILVLLIRFRTIIKLGKFFSYILDILCIASPIVLTVTIIIVIITDFNDSEHLTYIASILTAVYNCSAVLVVIYMDSYYMVKFYKIYKSKQSNPNNNIHLKIRLIKTIFVILIDILSIWIIFQYNISGVYTDNIVDAMDVLSLVCNLDLILDFIEYDITLLGISRNGISMRNAFTRINLRLRQPSNFENNEEEKIDSQI